MISLNLFRGGPEQATAPFGKAWRRVTTVVAECLGEGWVGKVPGVQIALYMAGSVSQYDEVQGIYVSRFSRKRRLILFNARVPEAVFNDFDKAFDFLLEVLRKAIACATDIFARKSDTPFDTEEANAAVAQVERYGVDAEFRQHIDSQMVPGA